MKTIWKTERSFEWLRAKQQWFEARTGVKWTFYTSGNGYIFNAVVTRNTGQCAALADKLFERMPKTKLWATNFQTLAKECGMDLADVLVAANTLVREGDGRCTPTVNTRGLFCAIKARARK